jgi:hypothetical protein
MNTITLSYGIARENLSKVDVVLSFDEVVDLAPKDTDLDELKLLCDSGELDGKITLSVSFKCNDKFELDANINPDDIEREFTKIIKSKIDQCIIISGAVCRKLTEQDRKIQMGSNCCNNDMRNSIIELGMGHVYVTGIWPDDGLRPLRDINYNDPVTYFNLSGIEEE